MQAKVCAFVLREDPTPAYLVFRHAFAGVQLVKGTVKQGEPPKDAMQRELLEESGLIAGDLAFLTTVQHDDLAQAWHVFQCWVDRAPDRWSFDTLDDDSQRFDFFWHPLTVAYPAEMHPKYKRTVEAVRPILA